MTKSTAKKKGPPEQETEPTPLKPQGNQPPSLTQLQPPDPSQGRQTEKTNEEKQEQQQETRKRRTQETTAKNEIPPSTEKVGKNGKRPQMKNRQKTNRQMCKNHKKKHNKPYQTHPKIPAKNETLSEDRCEKEKTNHFRTAKSRRKSSMRSRL